MHADLIERAARAKKAIFCEKPIDLEVARVERRLRGLELHGATLMLGFNRRFDPQFPGLQGASDAGAVGKLEIVIDHRRAIPAPPPIVLYRASPAASSATW